MGKKTILLVFGTRPEAIKMAPLVKTLQKDGTFDVKVAVTAQHREMLDQVLRLFGITPDYDLNMMKAGQTLSDITCGALTGIEKIARELKPWLLLVHGDTTTTLAASLAGFYAGVPVGHVEAGLRTNDKLAPWPEEINRRLTDVVADWYFAPTETNRQNLLAENVPAQRIFVTGNTVIDALLQAVSIDCPLDGLGLDGLDPDKKLILMTCHRRENWGAPMESIFAAVRRVKEQRDDIEIVYAVHKNPLVREIAQRHLGNVPGIRLIEPLDYHPFCAMMNRSYLLLTDSGGIQEEAPSLGKPVLVLRDVTERPEAVAAGTVRLAGTEGAKVEREILRLLDEPAAYRDMAERANPYGDGHASDKILHHIKQSQSGIFCSN